MNIKLSIYQKFSNEKEVCEIARVVRGYQKTKFFEGQKRWNHFFNVIKLYLSKNWSGAIYDKEKKQIPVSNGLVCREGSSLSPLEVPAEVIPTEISSDSDTKKIIVSDLDDTVIKSRAVSLSRLIFATLFKPLGKREVFPEVSEVYEKLKRGVDKKENNLFFYISSSTWNIFPLLKGFLDNSDIPGGILLLKEIDFGNTFESHLKHSHKLKKIQYLLNFYPEKKFILIGDAGQEDAQIYLEIAKKNPDRISHILIRYKWWEKILEDNPIEHIEQDGIILTYFKNLKDVPSEDLY